MSKWDKVLAGAAVTAAGAFAINWALSRYRKGWWHLSGTREPDLIDDMTGQPSWLRLPEPVGEEWLRYLEERGVYD